MRAGLLLLVAASAASTGCFASKTDFLKLQDDLAVTRASDLAADSAQREQLASVSRSLRALSDSLASLNRKVTAMRATSETDIAAIRQDISQLQDLSGQSEQRLRDMRAALEEKTRQQEAVTRPDASSDAGTPPAAASTAPGPAQLLQAGRDQLVRGANSAARSAFSELVAQYPNSEYAPEAIFYSAQSFAAERNPGAADSTYVVLIARFPNSPRVPTALYKRAQHMQATRRATQARQLYQEIIRRFPRSDEAALAEERLQAMR
ncbi:MAG TPA: tetratricopeptide repeat protein [Gemmatimonadaceae bacterium]|nr:tetratricopeptide repeat protein [Gemmatimonadaceae bacterium]